MLFIYALDNHRFVYFIFDWTRGPAYIAAWPLAFVAAIAFSLVAILLTGVRDRLARTACCQKRKNTRSRFFASDRVTAARDGGAGGGGVRTLPFQYFTDITNTTTTTVSGQPQQQQHGITMLLGGGSRTDPLLGGGGGGGGGGNVTESPPLYAAGANRKSHRGGGGGGGGRTINNNSNNSSGNGGSSSKPALAGDYQHYNVAGAQKTVELASFSDSEYDQRLQQQGCACL